MCIKITKMYTFVLTGDLHHYCWATDCQLL